MQVNKPQKVPIHDQKSEPGIKKLVGRAGICPKLKNLLLQSERKVEVQLRLRCRKQIIRESICSLRNTRKFGRKLFRRRAFRLDGIRSKD